MSILLEKIKTIDFYCDASSKKIILKYGYLFSIKNKVFFILSEYPILQFTENSFKTKIKDYNFRITSNELILDNQVFHDLSNPKLFNFRTYSDLCKLANLKAPCNTKDSLSDTFIKQQHTYLQKAIKNPAYLDVIYNYSIYGDTLNFRIRDNKLNFYDNLRITLLNNLINNAPVTDQIYKVFRGVNSDVFFVDTKKTFISTSILTSVANNFSDEKLFLDIIIPKNTHCLLFFLIETRFQKELELLLGTKSQFKIEIIKKNNKRIDLLLKII